MLLHEFHAWPHTWVLTQIRFACICDTAELCGQPEDLDKQCLPPHFWSWFAQFRQAFAHNVSTTADMLVVPTAETHGNCLQEYHRLWLPVSVFGARHSSNMLSCLGDSQRKRWCLDLLTL